MHKNIFSFPINKHRPIETSCIHEIVRLCLVPSKFKEKYERKRTEKKNRKKKSEEK